jgi:aquaporin Z
MVAGIAAALLLKVVFPSVPASLANLGAPGVANGVSAVQAFVIEVILTFFLVLVVYATAIDPRGAFNKVAGFGIGLVLFFDILMGGPLTGAAMNPARAFGPALVAGILDGSHFLVYWAGPVIGAALAASLYEGLLMRADTEEDVPPPSEEPART